MSKYDLENENYEVYYVLGKKVFSDVDAAIEFGRKMMNAGVDVTIYEINVLVGWY